MTSSTLTGQESASPPSRPLEEFKDLGFGSEVARGTRRRLLNRDGSFNVVLDGLNPLSSLSLYHWLLTISWPRFLGFICGVYIAVNTLFAFAFLALGLDACVGVSFGAYPEGSGADVEARDDSHVGIERPDYSVDVALDKSDVVIYPVVLRAVSSSTLAISPTSPTGEFDIYAQCLNPDGSPRWKADGATIAVPPHDQMLPQICSDSVEGAIIAWPDFQRGDPFLAANREPLRAGFHFHFEEC